jgi:hypothetical protein
VVNTLLFVGLGVNVKMFLALLLSGFFMRRRWWIKARARIQHRLLHLEMDAVLDRDLPRRPDGDPAGHL